MPTHQEFLVRTMGLTDEEAFLFLRVSSRGQITATAAAQLMDRSRGRAYELLRELVRQGFLEELPGRPLRFVPRPLRAAVTGKRTELEVRLAGLRQAEQSAANVVPLEVAEPGSTVSLLWGIKAVNREAARMMQGATSTIVVAGSVSFAADQEGFDIVLLAASEARVRGASVVFYLAAGPETARLRQQVELALGAGHVVEFAPGQMPDLSFVIADGEVLQCLPGSHGSDEQADDALGVKVRGQRLAQFTRLSMKALLGDGGGHSVEESFAEFQSIAARAKRSIDTLAGAGWRGLRSKEGLQGLGDAYHEAARRGVTIRTVLHDDGDARSTVVLGTTRVHSLLPMWLALVDGAVVFQVVREATGELRARLSADATVVRLFQALFEHTWLDARPMASTGAILQQGGSAPNATNTTNAATA